MHDARNEFQQRQRNAVQMINMEFHLYEKQKCRKNNSCCGRSFCSADASVQTQPSATFTFKCIGLFCSFLLLFLWFKLFLFVYRSAHSIFSFIWMEIISEIDHLTLGEAFRRLSCPLSTVVRCRTRESHFLLSHFSIGISIDWAKRDETDVIRVWAMPTEHFIFENINFERRIK